VEPPWPRPPQPIGFAHRGARSERRENTIEAFLRALELGATGLESDAWVTADGEVVLDHDGVTGGRWRRRPISGQARAQLPGHVPTLTELYQAGGTDFELSLDVKDSAALSPILAAATTAGARSRLWLCHPSRKILERWRAPAAGAKLVVSTRLNQFAGGLEAGVPDLRAGGLDAVNLHRREWTGAGVEAVHGAGLAAFGWDAQTRDQLSGLLQLGVDGVYSDHVDRMMDSIREWSVGRT
jgi:glycerophosphoryl diester phosphodiesterase